MDRPPDNLKVDFEIAMGQRITHLIGDGQGQFRMTGHKCREVLFDIMARFADNLKISNHSILNHLVEHECCFIHVVRIPLYAVNGLKNMGEIIDQSPLIAGHIGLA